MGLHCGEENCLACSCGKKIYAYNVAVRRGDGEAAARDAAAAVTPAHVQEQPTLPAAPDSINIGCKNLFDFLFVEVPPILNLLRLTRVRDADTRSASFNALRGGGAVNCSHPDCHDCARRGCSPAPCKEAWCGCTHRSRTTVTARPDR